jgi:hypothetical protein
MSINFNKFVPRPGLVNKQGCLPDPSELVCIEVPKMFDQCLIKRCLVYAPGPDTTTTDCELRSDPLTNPKRYIGSRDFNIALLSVDKSPWKGNSNFKRIVLCYRISFYADYIDCNGVNKSEFYEINRTDTIGKFYCPDSIAQVSSHSTYDCHSKDLDNSIIKLEMVAEALDGDFCEDCEERVFLDITLGYFLVVKCELIVQLLVPAYDYCPVPKEPCKDEPQPNPCEKFYNSPIPKFYPNQNLLPLFPCDDDDDDDDYDDDDDDHGCGCGCR